MALARCNFVIQDSSGNIVDGATVEVRRESDSLLAAVYSDRAGSSPLGNPYVASNGADAGFYVAGGAHKITVTHASFGTREWRYEPVGLMSEEDAISAEEVSYSDGNSPSLYSTVQGALDGLFNAKAFTPEDFQAEGDGSTDDRAALVNMAAAVRAAGGGVVEFGVNKNYRVFATDPGAGTYNILDFSSCNGLRINFHGSKISTDLDMVTETVAARIILLDGCSDVVIDGIQIETTGGAASILYGFMGVYLNNTNRDIVLLNSRMTGGGRSFLESVRTSELSLANRCRGLTILNAYVEDVYYGVALTKNGDQTTIRGLKGVNCGRVFDAYNVRQLDVEIESIPGANTVGDLLLGVYTINTESASSNTLSDVKLRYLSRSQTDSHAGFTGIFIQQQDASSTAGFIRNVSINLDIEISTAANTSPAFELFKQANGGGADTTTRNHVVENVHVSGSLKDFANNIDVVLLGQTGTWGGETVRNLDFSDLTTTGSGTGAWEINGTGLGTLRFSGVISAHNLTVTNQAAVYISERKTTFANNTDAVFGRIISSTVLVGAAVSLTTLTAANITSISLPPGTWDVWGSIATTVNGATVSNAIYGWISTTSAALPTIPNEGAYFQHTLGSTGQNYMGPVGRRRIVVASTQTVYLSMRLDFTTNTAAGYGFLAARRIDD